MAALYNRFLRALRDFVVNLFFADSGKTSPVRARFGLGTAQDSPRSHEAHEGYTKDELGVIHSTFCTNETIWCFGIEEIGPLSTPAGASI